MEIKGLHVSKISWGKVVIGAAAAAGAVAVIAYCPALTNAVGSALSSLASHFGDVGTWIAQHTGAAINLIQENARIAVGSAAAAGAMSAISLQKTDEHIQTVAAAREEAVNNRFAQRHQMEAAHTRLINRFRDEEYAPAMAAIASRA